MRNILRRRLPRVIFLLGLILLAGASCFSPGNLAQGGLPNLNAPTLGGRQLWADVDWAGGWRVQRHVWLRHFRLLDSENRRRAWGTQGYCAAQLPQAQGEHLVVLLHGLGRTRFSMNTLKERLEGQGYRVANIGYPSTRGSVNEHAKTVESVLNGLGKVERVSFVTHSLGGRVVLRLLAREGAWMERVAIERVVQLGPPNRGSGSSVVFSSIPFVGAILGPAFLELAEAGDEEPPESVPFAVIAGVRGESSGWNPLLPGDDDGLVGLAETRPKFRHSHLRVKSLHTFLMTDVKVFDAIALFLDCGEFEAQGTPRGQVVEPRIGWY